MLALLVASLLSKPTHQCSDTVPQARLKCGVSFFSEYSLTPIRHTMGSCLPQEPTVMAHCGTEDPVAAMKFVREEKSGGAWKNVQEQKGRI